LAWGRGPGSELGDKQIAFSHDNNESEPHVKELYGTAAIAMENGEWKCLYEPFTWDHHYYPLQNLNIYYKVVEHRHFSWSHDGRFIVIAAGYEMSTDLFFSLELATVGQG
jgi:hypothetical protein